MTPSGWPLILVVEREGEIIGDQMLVIEDAWAQVEVADRRREPSRPRSAGSSLPDHSGRGYATEAAEGLLGICFDGLGLRRVTAQCFADNVASWRLMERIGMRREEYAVRDALHRSRGWLDAVTYAILADEWRARQPVD